MRLGLYSIVGILCATLTACSSLFPGEVAAGTAVRVLVLKYDGSQDSYKLVQEELTTLHNLRTLQGDAAEIFGGADMLVDYTAIAKADPQSKEALWSLVFRTEGAPVDVSLFDVSGLLHPEDFHSLSLVTLYFNFEQAHLFFKRLGAPLVGLPVQYFPTLAYARNGVEIVRSDNASWDPIVHTFAVLPFKDVKELPLGLNLGVVGHEYAHAVFQSRVFSRDEGVPWLYRKALQEPEKYTPAANLNLVINEGLADFFGAAISGDPDFLKKSLPAQADARRLNPAQPRCVKPDQLEAIGTATLDAFDPYPVGSVLAAALWEGVSSRPNRLEAFARSLGDGMLEVGNRFVTNEDRTRLPDIIDAIAFNVVSDLKEETCGILLDRFRLQAADVPSCAVSTAPRASCGR